MARGTRAARNGHTADNARHEFAKPPEPEKKGKRKNSVRVQSTASPPSNVGAILEGLEDLGPMKTRRVLQMSLDQGPINNVLPDEVRVEV